MSHFYYELTRKTEILRHRFAAMILMIICVVVAPIAIRADALPRADLVLWHSQGEAVMNSLGIQKIFDAWASTHAPGSTLTLVQKEDDDLPADFPSAVYQKRSPPPLFLTSPESGHKSPPPSTFPPVRSFVPPTPLTPP